MLTVAGVITLGVGMFFRERLVGVGSTDKHLIDSLKSLVESQLLEMKQLRERVDRLEHYRAVVDVFGEVLSRHSQEVVDLLRQRLGPS